jgi:hypothetical protein
MDGAKVFYLLHLPRCAFYLLRLMLIMFCFFETEHPDFIFSFVVIYVSSGECSCIARACPASVLLLSAQKRCNIQTNAQCNGSNGETEQRRMTFALYGVWLLVISLQAAAAFQALEYYRTRGTRATPSFSRISAAFILKSRAAHRLV